MKKLKSYIIIILFSALIPMALSNIPAHASNNDKSRSYQVHTIKSGDSLSKIAKEYYNDSKKVALIAEFNNIKDIDKLKIGQKIKVPILLLEPSKKASTVKEENLGISRQGEAETLEEKSLNKGPVNSRLDGPTLFFIIICLLVILSLLLFKWIGRQDVHHAKKSMDDIRPVSSHKWRL